MLQLDCFYKIQFNFLPLTCGGEKSMQLRVKRFNVSDGNNRLLDAALTKITFARDESVQRHFPVVQPEASPSAPNRPLVRRETGSSRRVFFYFICFILFFFKERRCTANLQSENSFWSHLPTAKKDKTSQRGFRSDEAASGVTGSAARNLHKQAPQKRDERKNTL